MKLQYYKDTYKPIKASKPTILDKVNRIFFVATVILGIALIVNIII